MLSTCYAIRLMVHISNINTLKSIYYTYMHSIIKYGIIVWGNSSKRGKIFSLEKKIVRNMVGAQPRSSFRSLFEQLEILPVPCQYILPLLNLIINNQKIFQTNLSIHNSNSRNKHFFIDQMPTYFVFKKVHFMLTQKFSTVYHLVWQSSRMKRLNLKQSLKNM